MLHKRIVCGIVSVLLVLSTLSLAFSIQSVRTWTGGTIYIRADGSISPDTAPISAVDNVTYILTDNISGNLTSGQCAIVVERDDIVLDGAGYGIQSNGSGTGIDVVHGSNITIRNVEIESFRHGLWLSHSVNNSICGNRFVNNSRSILGGHSNYSNIHGNSITNSNLDGIWLFYSLSNNVYGNNFADNFRGIGFCRCSNSTISGNNITNSKGDGIQLYGSASSTISGNNMVANKGHAIMLMESSNYNSFSGNNITGNGFGITLFETSNNNTISGNNIIDNRYGITIYKASNNTFCHNNFIGNTQQADVYTSGFTNLWDDGCEGNYWSDYNGTDSSIPPDGIGDTPYIIDKNNNDRYPLMNPYWNPTDINHDLKVDIGDVDPAAKAFGSFPGFPNWNCHTDITGLIPLEPDGQVDMRDVAMVCKHFGEIDP